MCDIHYEKVTFQHLAQFLYLIVDATDDYKSPDWLVAQCMYLLHVTLY